MRNKRRQILCTAILSAVAVAAGAQGVTVESVASTIARQHNENSAAMLDDMTVSTSAEALGRNVIFRYTLKVRRGIPASELAEFRTENRKMLTARTCKANANNVAFDRGLFYTFVYQNRYGEPLDEVRVSKTDCTRP